MPYTLHPSDKLVSIFKGKPYQGCNPSTAQYLFVGLDANYAADIETSLPEVFDYLESGSDFWRRTNVHHPFRLPGYKGSGKKYHDKFAEIGFTPEHADLVSFVELLHLPTVGVSKLTASDFSKDHLHSLADIFDNGNAKFIFLSARVADLMRQTKVFRWLPEKPLRMDGDLAVLRDQNDRIVYRMYHLSCYGHQLKMLNRQVVQISGIVNTGRADQRA